MTNSVAHCNIARQQYTRHVKGQARVIRVTAVIGEKQSSLRLLRYRPAFSSRVVNSVNLTQLKHSCSFRYDKALASDRPARKQRYATSILVCFRFHPNCEGLQCSKLAPIQLKLFTNLLCAQWVVLKCPPFW